MKDRVNCPFYFKIGACRHGDRCSRQHHKPPFSQTILIKHMWVNPQAQVAAAGGDLAAMDQKQLQEDFDDFYEEVETHKLLAEAIGGLSGRLNHFEWVSFVPVVLAVA